MLGLRSDLFAGEGVGDFGLEGFPHFAEESGLCKRFLDQLGTFRQGFPMNDDVIGVAGHEKDFHVRAEGEQLVGQFAAIETRHHYVREQEIDFTVRIFCGADGVFDFRGFENGIPGVLQKYAG